MKKGFKHTEIGLIPEDWEVKKLGEVGEVRMCKRVFNYQTQEHGEIPFYKIGTFGKEPDAYISKELYDNYRQRFSFPKKGDILISASGTIGRTLVYDGSPSYYQDSNIVWIENNETLISNEFLFYVLQVVKYNTEGGTIQRLYNNILKNTKFICPPTKAEQTRIATVLSDTDALIEKLEQLIAKKRNIKTAAMQELLKPQKGWKWTTIEKLGKPYGGLSGKAKIDFKDGNRPYIPFMNVMRNPIIDTTYFDYVKIAPTENQNKAEKGDLFFNSSSETPEEVGMCSVLLEDIPNLYLNSFCFGFRLNKEVKNDGLYLAYFFRSSYGRKIFYILAQGATRHNLSKSDFLKIEIQIPEPDEQVKIATILRDMDNEIQALEKQLEKYKMLKQGMMQVLLTGKIRLV